MRKLFAFLIGLAACASAWLGVRGQDPSGTPIFSQIREFMVPFKLVQKDADLAEIRLYASSDQGRTWQRIATAAPSARSFHVNVPQDGLYWFALQQVDKQNRVMPPTLEGLQPGLRLIVDTVKPVVAVQALPPRGEEVGVSWSVRDDNFDATLPDAVRVDYRIQGGMTWNPLRISAGSNQIYWNPRTNMPVEVRVSARDRANNVGQDQTTVSQGTAIAPPPPMNAQPIAADPGLRDLDRKYVNNKTVSLSYDLQEFGRSGVASVELWFTKYKVQGWSKLHEYPIEANAGQSKKLSFDVLEEGIYGITLVAKSGVGLGEQPPKIGDRPQVWIEVDLTKPVVQIGNVTVGSKEDKGKLTVHWAVFDKNLAPTPITLSYAEKREGPFTPIADKLANTGRYVWQMNEQELPYQFFLKIEAVDLAGNVGEAITPERIKVDLATPKARILKIESGNP